MTRSLRVDAYDDTVKAAVEMGHGEKAGFILRIQEKKELLFNLNNGETEEIATISLRGMGIQVCTPEGYTGFASSDRIDPSTLRSFPASLGAGKKVEAVKGEVNTAVLRTAQPAVVLPLNTRMVLALCRDRERLVKLNKVGHRPRLSIFRPPAVDEEWRWRGRRDRYSFMTPFLHL